MKTKKLVNYKMSTVFCIVFSFLSSFVFYFLCLPFSIISILLLKMIFLHEKPKLYVVMFCNVNLRANLRSEMEDQNIVLCR